MSPLKQNGKRYAALMILLVSPLTMGGCPELQDRTADAVETAVRSILDAAVTEFFNGLRTN